jgi:hypothetical protein
MKKVSEQGAELLAAWRESGLSRRQFCIQNDIPYSKFTYWVRRSETVTRSGFDLVQVGRAEFAEQQPLQILFPSGVKIMLEHVPSIEWLKKLIS